MFTSPVVLAPSPGTHKEQSPNTLGPFQSAYHPNKSTGDTRAPAINMTSSSSSSTSSTLTNLDKVDNYMRMLFIDLSVQRNHLEKGVACWTWTPPSELDPGLSDWDTIRTDNTTPTLALPRAVCSVYHCSRYLATMTSESVYKEELDQLAKWSRDSNLSLNAEMINLYCISTDQLWKESKVSWCARYRGPLLNSTTLPAKPRKPSSISTSCGGWRNLISFLITPPSSPPSTERQYSVSCLTLGYANCTSD